MTKEFDTVCFFDRDDEAVAETRKRIPGARGFPGDFVEVLLETPDGGGLKSPTAAQNTIEERTVSQLSPMPANLVDSISEADLYHLLAFLLAQKMPPLLPGDKKP